MEERVRLQYKIPDLQARLSRMVRNCERCHAYIHEVKDPPIRIKTTRVMQIVMFDLTKMKMVTPEGYTHILTMVDHFTKYKWAFPVRGKQAQPIADIMLETFKDRGAPERWHCDNGSEFVNSCMDRVREALGGVPQSTSMPRNPQCQGLVEKFNDTLKIKLAKVCTDAGWDHTMKEFDWNKFLPEIMYGENTTMVFPSRTMPFIAMNLRPPAAPDAMALEPEDVQELYDHMADLQHNTNKMHTAREFNIGDVVNVRANKTMIAKRRAISAWSGKAVIQEVREPEQQGHGEYYMMTWITRGQMGERPGDNSKRWYHWARLRYALNQDASMNQPHTADEGDDTDDSQKVLDSDYEQATGEDNATDGSDIDSDDIPIKELSKIHPRPKQPKV